MTGDYTKVPLRRLEPWTGARMQQGRVLLDHEWNLNLDAASRNAETIVQDVVGPAGVVDGTDDFKVTYAPGTAGTPADLSVHAGHMWIGGMLAIAPKDFTYRSQLDGNPSLPALPTAGKFLVYVEAFPEHVQPQEAIDEVPDPALAPGDSAARTRVGYRIRFKPTSALNCRTAWQQFVGSLDARPQSTGSLTIKRTGPPTTSDPCNPPGDPRGVITDGLLRIEVLDADDETKARFAWSYEDGAAAVAVARDTTGWQVVQSKVQLVPTPSARFAKNDLVEVSWLGRRADRQNHGALYTVTDPGISAGGDALTLDREVMFPPKAEGLVVRRWDGEVVGAGTARKALQNGDDLGVEFTATAGDFFVGDWWGARLREAAANGIETRTAAEPDGIRHAFAPLAIVDTSLPAASAATSCRPTFTPLTVENRFGTCTVSIRPDDDVQDAIDRMPSSGGELCLGEGSYPLDAVVMIVNKKRIVITGAGPSTILRATRYNVALLFQGCDEIVVRNLRAEGGNDPRPNRAKDAVREGALSFSGCGNVLVADCVLTCPDRTEQVQSCLTIRADPTHDLDATRIERNRFIAGAWQTAVLLIDVTRAAVSGNRVEMGPGPLVPVTGEPFLAREFGRMLREAVSDTRGEPTDQVKLANGAIIPVKKAAPATDLVKEFGSLATTGFIQRHKDEMHALTAFGRELGAGHFVDQLKPASRALFNDGVRQFRAVAEGIVVAGTRIGDVDVSANVVESVVQGIHIGVNNPKAAGRESAERVRLDGNVVKLLVPKGYDADRLAVFVGNAGSVNVTDTFATLTRTGDKLTTRKTLVEGIRVHGVLGAFLKVRQSSLQGFSVGVRVVPIQPIPRQRMWLVAETMAAGGSLGLDAPPEIERQRNYPLIAWRTTWAQIVAMSFGAPAGLAFYDRLKGEAEFYTVDGTGGVSLLKMHAGWRKTWDVIAPIQIDGTSGLFFYDQQGKKYEMYKVNDHGEMTFVRKVDDPAASPQWDIIAPVTVGGLSGLLFYSSSNQSIDVRIVGAQGTFHTSQPQTGMSPSWSTIVGIQVAGQSAFFAYDRKNNTADAYSLDAQGKATLVRHFAVTGGPFDLIVPIRPGGKAGLALYEATGGALEVWVFDPRVFVPSAPPLDAIAFAPGVIRNLRGRVVTGVTTGTIIGTVNTGTVNTGTVNTGTVNTGTANTGTVMTGTTPPGGVTPGPATATPTPAPPAPIATVLKRQTGWRKTWNIMVARTFGGVPGLVLYERAGALGAFYTIDPTGEISELVTTW